MAHPLRAGERHGDTCDRVRHREHQLFRHHGQGPLRADAVRTPAGLRTAVLPQPDGAPGARRRRSPCAGTRSHRRLVLALERQAREPGDAHRRLAGRRAPPQHCAAVGAALARLHVASRIYRARLSNRRGPAWWRQAARAVSAPLRRNRSPCSTPNSSSRRALAASSCPKAPSMATSSATTCCFTTGALRASSTSDLPRPISLRTTLPSPSTTGASTMPASRRSTPSARRPWSPPTMP